MANRNRRSGVEDRWLKANKDKSAQFGVGKRWRARYVDDLGKEHARSFDRKADAQGWLDGTVSTLVQGTHVAPRDAKLTVQQWCDQWIVGYGVNRDSTVRQARTHIAQITAEFGTLPLAGIRPSMVKAWTAKLAKAGMADSYVHALHQRLSQILSDAVHDNLLGRNPCSRRTSPPMGKAKIYLITTAQLWALYEAMADHLKPAILLGAFAGLRVAEASALRVDDVDFIRGVVHPKLQWPAKPLKTEGSEAPIPIPHEMTLLLSSFVKLWPHENMVTNGRGGAAGPWVIDREIRRVRPDIEGLPEEFTFHDLRHYLASLLIHSGADIKTVQARVRHASAKTTLDIYGHLWPDADESTRAAVGAVIAARMDSLKAAAD
ncbi:site-specific integrase [Rhodococcus sp. IEGM 1330]|uniref:tyrosine-type recombinase/integrase n=1 Tax=Rhodococcus sp. IEGM 1330 TaxID=3082225 RepID=UPI002953D35E|nr:site-specific integrase [Rhodococcus sp. IEGM 1330]MDV8024011.1 site-specific integrase [Rhodococcus sp. IEGM 1330]